MHSYSITDYYSINNNIMEFYPLSMAHGICMIRLTILYKNKDKDSSTKTARGFVLTHAEKIPLRIKHVSNENS